MKMFGLPIYLTYLYLLVVGCASPKSASTSSTGSGKYTEDLSVLRPKVETVNIDTVAQTSVENKTTTYVEPKFNVNDKLDTVLDSIDRINLSRKVIEGFAIQVYAGKREEALNVKKQLTTYLPDIESEIQFTEPIFRVKAGKYYNRLEAQKDYLEIKRYFPAAILIPERIPIN